MNDLPDVADVDPDTITAAVLTKQGWVTPDPESIDALERLLAQKNGHPETSGFHRQLDEQVAVMAARLRKKYQGKPERLARLDELTR